MNSVSRLCRLLSPLRIYALGQDSLIDQELKAYGAGFSLLEEQLALLEHDVLPQTATAKGLNLHEAAAGLPTRNAPQQARRDLILARRQRPRLPTPAGALALLKAAGLLEPEVFEEEGTLFLAASGVAQGLDPDAAWQLALESLPAHLPVETNAQGRNWESLEALGLSCDAFDALEKCWSLLAFTGTSQT